VGFWLLKSDPEDYSYDDLERDKKTVWDGVANNLALLNLRAVKKGDLAFIYHTGSERRIIGIADVTSDPYPDPKARNQRFLVINVAAKRRLQKYVALDEVKARKEFKDFDLVRLPRLSVMPVDSERWKRLLKLSEFGNR
jgi:predicted RNA-binding protein with PUA-like domain